MDKKKLLILGVVGVAAATIIVSGVLILGNAEKSTPKLDVDGIILNQDGLLLKEAKYSKDNSARQDIKNSLLKNYTFYRGVTNVYEKQSWKSKYADGSSGTGEANYVSEELLIYDGATKKSYIVSRRLNYDSQHLITVNDMSGKFIQKANVNAIGYLTEYYGTGLLQIKVAEDNSQSAIIKYVLNFSNNPVRFDNENNLMFTDPPTKKENWVTYLTTEGTYREGGARVFTPEDLTLNQIGQMPNIENFSEVKTYNSDQTQVWEATDRFWNSAGSFSCKYEKISFEDFEQVLLEMKTDSDWEETCEDMAKDHPESWKETAKFVDLLGQIVDASISAENTFNSIKAEKSEDTKKIREALDGVFNEQEQFNDKLNLMRKVLNDVRADQGGGGGSLRTLEDVTINSSSGEGGKEQKKLKASFAEVLPLLKEILNEYSSTLDSLLKTVKELKTYSAIDKNLPTNKIFTLLQDCQKGFENLNKLNGYLNTIILDTQSNLIALNKKEKPNNEVKYGELNNLYGQWQKTLLMYKGKSDTIVDAEKGITLPAEYPIKVVPIMEGAIIMVFEKVKEEGIEALGYTLSYKVNATTEEILSYYKNAFSKVPGITTFTLGEVTTMTGIKDNFEINLMITKNNLGGTEKSLVQITLLPLN